MSISIAHKDQGSATDCALTKIIASRNTALNVASVTGILVTLTEIDNLQVRNLMLLVVTGRHILPLCCSSDVIFGDIGGKSVYTRINTA